MTREDRINVFLDTYQRSKTTSDKVTNVFYHGTLRNSGAKLPQGALTPITMVHGGTVGSGYKYAKGMHVAVLNFANAVRFGGYVEYGSNSQEEGLCRCTDLFNVLAREECQAEYYTPNLRELYQSGYRRANTEGDMGTDRIIYSRGIKVLKNDTNYATVAPRRLDVITCASPSVTLRAHNAYYVYVKRIEQIVLSAKVNHADCLVLGAWGCGAFKQNPYVMARAFATVLNKYGGCFKKIVFAIKATTAERGDDAYEVFKDVFEVYYKGKVVEE